MPRFIEDVESDETPGVAAAARGMSEYSQFRLPNGKIMVIGKNSNTDDVVSQPTSPSRPNNRGPPGGLPDQASDRAKEVTDFGEVSRKVGEAEAALAKHKVGEHELRFQDVLEHDELNTRSSQPYEANGMQNKVDSAAYRESTNGLWQEKFLFEVPADYSGPVRVGFELRAENDHSVAHGRVVRGDDMVYQVNSDDAEYVEYEYVTEDIPEGVSEAFKFEMRGVSTAIGDSEGPKVRARGISGSPRFTHEGETYWLNEVVRESLPEDELRERLNI